MVNHSDKSLSFWLGILCFAASIATLFFQQQLGAMFGSAVVIIWLVLGGLGIYLVTKDQPDGPYSP